MSLLQGRPVRIVNQPSVESSMLKIYAGPLSKDQQCVVVEAGRTSTASEVKLTAVAKLRLGNSEEYDLAEIVVTEGQLCKERRLEDEEHPVQTQLLWPKIINTEKDQERGLVSGYMFYIRKKDSDSLSRTPSWAEKHDVAGFLISFLRQSSSNKEYTDLCNLPDLNEQTLLENIKSRFKNGNIYTYVGEILIAVNPFKFFPIYNPTYVKMYQNKRLGELPPHIFAIADAAFHKMLRTKQNQCIVISGESGSGKTESTNLLLHHLTALSQKGHHASGVEQTILGAGPVLEAFGNAKTVHNNNSSRFGKFIQVNYKENGMVHGAVVEKYLLEKSRIVAQAKDERNYHVFYYLLAGADKQERKELHLDSPDKYYYLSPESQSESFTLDGVDEVHEFARLRESMGLVGFSQEAEGKIFCVLSAVLHLGNIEFRKRGDQSFDESVVIKDEESIRIVSNLLKVKEKTLVEALTQKRTIAGEETLVMNYKMEEAIATRDAMAKCLYGALFDWIVLKVNHALLAKRHHSEHQGNSIGVLDIFGFEDFQKNSFEQFCINYANEHLQYYFNQHIFKLEQEEYRKEGIEWKNIDFIDNTGCLELFSKRGGLFFQLDEECNFPAGNNESLLQKYHQQHAPSSYYTAPQLREQAFCIEHYAGKVKYDITDFREKNNDLVRMDIVGVLKNSSLAFVRELMGDDPVAVLRWSILRAVIKSMFAFKDSGKAYRKRGGAPKRHSLHLPISTHIEAGDANSEDTDATVNGTDEEMADQINKNALVWLSKQPDLTAKQYRLIRKASKVLLPKSEKNRIRQHRSFHDDIKALKNIASRAKFTSGKLTSKKAPPSVSTQFQWSLTRLLTTLNQANPFFIRCIKSNAEKGPCIFDDTIVLRQLRYTGMLATVKIRQSGYNYRLAFDEFSEMYKILLPHGESSTQEDIKAFLEKRDIHRDNYQVGKSKVFLREADKILLDEALHNAIMERVVRIQCWMKTILQRKHFLCALKLIQELQRYARGFLARRRVEALRSAIICIQCAVRGYLQRKKYRLLLEQKRLIEEDERLRKKEMSSTSDSGKGSSMEELDVDRDETPRKHQDHVNAIKQALSAKQEKDTPKELVKPGKKGKKKISLPINDDIEAALSNHQEKLNEGSKASTQKTSGLLKRVERIIYPRRKQQTSVEENEDDQTFKKKYQENVGVQVLPVPNKSPLSPRKEQSPEPKPRKPKKTIRKVEQGKGPPGNWMMSRSFQWQYDAKIEINDIQQLENLEEFLGKKLKELNKDHGKRDTIFDVVFKKALKDFQTEIRVTRSIAMQEEPVHIKYRDLMTKFNNIIQSREEGENTSASFSITMGINAFRGFLDEFMKKKKPPGRKPDARVVKKEKNRKECIEYLSHKFLYQGIVVLPTCCESCSNWISQHAYICEYCKYTCHEHCYNKSNIPCKGYSSNQYKNRPSSGLFGAPINYFNKDSSGWTVFENLINSIETQGLYTEGVYRKSGAAQKIKQLRKAMMEDVNKVDFNNYHVHVLTNTLKDIIREMPEPLLTYELFYDFIKAAEVNDEKDRLLGIYAVLDKLPKPNHDLFERLIFHLARIAQHEDSNKMSPYGLAIIFAPSLMRPEKKLQAQDSLVLVPKQTTCIQEIICKQLNNLKLTLNDISTLESATENATHHLSVMQAVIRASMRMSKNYPTKEVPTEPMCEVEEDDELDDVQETVHVLSEHINSLQRRKQTLTYQLPALELRHVSTSDDDFISVDDAESTFDSIDEAEDPYEEYAVTFDLPVTPPQLQHLNKSRAALPSRQLPKRFEAAVRRARANQRVHFYTGAVQLESMYITKPENLHNIREEHAEILV